MPLLEDAEPPVNTLAWAARAQPKDVGRRLRWVSRLGQLGHDGEALAALSEGLALMPGSADLLSEQAARLRRAGQLEAAEAAILALQEQYPHHPRLMRLRGELAEAAGDCEAARAIYAADVMAHPKDIGQRLRWVRCLAQLGRRDEALAALAAGLALMPASPDLFSEQVFRLRQAGKLEAAEAALLALDQQHPHHPRLPRLRGELAEAAGDHEAAETIYGADVTTHPKDVGQRLRWVRCLAQLGRRDEALAALSEGLALQPASADLLGDQAFRLRQAGKLEAAEAALLALAQQHPHHPRLPRLRGELAEAAGDHEFARRIYGADVAAHPKDIGQRLRWVRCLAQLGRHDEALAALAAGLALTPASPDLLSEQAFRLRQAGRTEAAKAALLALAERHPGHPRLPRLGGELAEATGDYATAARIYAADVAAHPKDVRQRLRWVRCLAQLGRHGEAVAALSAGLALMPGSADLLSEQASRLRQAGQFKAATAAVRALAEQHPHHPRLPRLRGELAEALGDRDGARTIYAADVAAHPKDVGQRLRWVRCLAQLGRQGEALAGLAEGLALMPGSADLLSEQAFLLRQAGKFEAAAAAVRAVAERDPRHPRLPRLRGELAEAAGDYAAASRVYAADVRAHPNDVGQRLRWVRCLAQLGRHGEALAALAEGLALMPASADLLSEQASRLRQAGQIEAAEAAILTLEELHPRHPRLPRLRGELAEAVGDRDAAIDIYAANVAADPNDVGHRLRWARCLARLGRHGEALAALSEGLALMPGSADLLSERAFLLRQAGQFEASEFAILALDEEHPEDLRLPRLRGELAEALGDREGARSIYAADVAAHPSDVGQRLRWVRCLTRLSRHGEALAALAEGLALVPGSADLLSERALVLRQAEQFQAAEAAILALHERYPADPRLPRLRGELAEALGDYDAARSIYAADLATHPNDVGQRLRLARVLLGFGLGTEALALIGSPATPAEWHLRGECLVELGRWEDAAELLEAWPDAEDKASMKTRLRVRLANLKFDHQYAVGIAKAAFDEAPNDVNASALALSAGLTFQADLAWKALLRVPGRPPGGGPARRGTGRLRNLVGQIVNELRLRPRATGDLAVAAQGPGEVLAKVGALQLSADPSSFGAALAVLIGLARAERLEALASSAKGVSTAIPAKLHQYWNDNSPPPDVARLMERAAEVNRGFAYQCWNDVTARRFLASLDQPELLRAYKAAPHVAMRTDLFRLAVLYAEGGIYLDADDYCTRPLQDLLPSGAELVCYQEHFGSIGNNFLAARPGHPFIGAALASAMKAVLEGAGESVWLATGPGLISRVLAASLAAEHGLEVPAGLHILPLRFFWHVVHPGRRVSYKTGRRHWSRAA